MAMLTALVVDDASFVRDLVKRTMRQYFPVIEMTDAQNGRRAQSLMSRHRYDLILCDWEMPEMSGLELLQWTRQQPQYEKVPFIMITSRGDKDHVVQAIKEGVSEYLGKPFSPEGLSRKVTKVMGAVLGKAMAQGGAGGSGKADAFMESASLLTGASSVKQAAAAPAPAKQAGSGKAPERSSVGKRGGAKTGASMRFASQTLTALVRDITLTEVRLLVPGGEACPGILEQAVVDIETGEGKMARLNGYIHQLQAMENSPNPEQVGITVRFVDDDSAKLEDLSRFIARFRTGQ